MCVGAPFPQASHLSQDGGCYQTWCSLIYLICEVCNRSPLRACAAQPSAKCKTVPRFSLLPPQRLTASPVVIFGSSLMRLGSISPSKVGNLQWCSHSCTLRVRQFGDQWGFLLLHLAIRFLSRFVRFEPPLLLQPSEKWLR